ncbi:MAG TPA: hypothetical protein VMY69_02500, partial [Phycisphaerae bacterium]|nr:hypothetical protein [Phycisphaerae bacterium]
IRRARRLWDRVIQGRGANVSAMVILGALAGVDPLERVAERPPPERQWLDHLVDVLVERRLARQRLAAVANAALGLVAERLGCPMPPKVLSAYLGVRATRFRHMVFGRRGSGAEGVEKGRKTATMSAFTVRPACCEAGQCDRRPVRGEASRRPACGGRRGQGPNGAGGWNGSEACGGIDPHIFGGRVPPDGFRGGGQG